MPFMAINRTGLGARSYYGSDVELPVTGEIQNYTYVSAVTLRNTFPMFESPEDPAAAQALDALRTFDLAPDQPTDADIDRSLRFVKR